MEKINANAILRFNDNQLQNVRKAIGYEDENKLKQDIELLRNWIRKANHFKVKEFDDGFLERLLIYNKGSIERTKQRFDKLSTCTNLMPEFLQNYDIKNEFQHLFNILNAYVLPKPTKDNYRIIMSDFTGTDDDEFKIIHLYRYIMVMGHYMMNNDYCLGYEWIGDSRNMTMGTITKCNPVIMHKGLMLFIDAMGHRLKKIHLISGSKFFDAILLLCKQIIPAKLQTRIVIHTNLESLHEHCPREGLPKELGGYLKSTKELNDITFKELSSEKHIERVKFMTTVATDETCRLPGAFNEEYSGMPGSFKTLCVD